jgi:hypothetical protein
LDQDEVQSLFERFAAPLAAYVALGGRKEAMEAVARTLWFTVIGGPHIEEQMWAELGKSGDVDANLLESIRTCYAEEMKPVVSDEQLAALRRRYNIRVEE